MSRLITTSGRHGKAAGQPVRLRDWRVENWSLRTKMAMVLLTPTLVAVVLGANQVHTELALAGQAAVLDDWVAAIDQGLVTAHALQRERDLAVTGGTTELARQREQVDTAVAAFDAKLTGHPDLAADSGITQARRELGDLPAARQSSGGSATSQLAVFNAYSAIISPLLTLSVATENHSDDATTRGTSDALVDVGQVIEQIQAQQVLLAAAAARGTLSADALDALRIAQGRTEDALSDLHDALSGDQLSAFGATVDSHALDNRDQVENQALARAQSGARLGLSVDAWRRACQPVVDKLTRFESTLSGSLSDAVSQLGSSSKTSSLRDAALVIGALLVGLVLALYFAGTMLRPLWILRRRALDVAKWELPEAIERFAQAPAAAGEILLKPVEVSTSEEIGQVARAFDEVHTAVVRLAAEQAALRHSVNEIFVSLSRRTQSLVENQLRMIDDMESNELDPDQLDRLFKLDHLATRMRRNSENLLVLAGASLRRATNRPVALTDMLQAAVSEVEQYTRIVLKPAPDVVMLGAAVSDVVHLLAELLDNATAYSSPQTEVTVVCTLREEGDLRIAVADEGVGLSTSDSEELNRQLAEAAAIEAAVSQQMGLFVVSRLAARRGIVVRLRANAGVGTVADVTLPGDLLRPAEPRQSVPRQRGFAAATVMQVRRQFAETETETETGTGASMPELPAITPIFDEIASTWFRRPGPGDQANAGAWSSAADEMWHMSDRLNEPVIDGYTAVGLPRRVRGALLLRGAVPKATSPTTQEGGTLS